VLVVVGSALALASVAACGGSDQSSKVKGVAWQWSALQAGEGLLGVVPIPDPQAYLLRLDDDGSFIARADCRSVSGTYSLSGDELTLAVGPTAKVACGPNSRADEYVELLRKVATYDVHEEGALALGLETDAGHMYFYAASS
jgi:heat shock protein HslJ